MLLFSWENHSCANTGGFCIVKTSGIMRSGEGCLHERDITKELMKSLWCGSAEMPVFLLANLECPYQKIARSWAWRNKRLVESLSFMVRNNSLPVPSPKLPQTPLWVLGYLPLWKHPQPARGDDTWSLAKKRDLVLSLHLLLSPTLAELCLWETKEKENGCRKIEPALLQYTG